MKDIKQFLVEHSYSDITDVSELAQYIIEKKNDKPEEKETEEIPANNEPEEISKKSMAKDDEKVHYAEQDKNGCIFDNIILFTNDKDPKGNKTLKNI
ncbi:MAG: hypothetical protein IIZ78_06110, partial [Clostridiales bacterium]|nr:hypothetical protein [Clostridiales bacterium]